MHTETHMSPAPFVSENLLPVETSVNSSKEPVCGLDFLRGRAEKKKSAPYQRLCLVLHQSSSTGGKKANIKQKRVKTPAMLGRAPAG